MKYNFRKSFIEYLRVKSHSKDLKKFIRKLLAYYSRGKQNISSNFFEIIDFTSI